MKALLLSISAAALLTASPVQADPNWTGPYIGANLGFAHSATDVDLSHSTGAIFYNDPFAPSSGSLSSDTGFAGGLELGYNHQFQNVVLGFAADVSWTDTDNDGTFTTPLGSKWAINSSPDMFGTLRGKLGYLVRPSILLYATGGLAWGQFDVNQATTFVDGNGKQFDVGGVTSGSFNHIGYTVGGGLEYAINQNWSIKAEYLFLDFGSEDYQLEGHVKPDPKSAPYVETFSADQQMQIGRIGINYKF